VFILQIGKLSRLVTSHPGQLSLAIPLRVSAVSTNKSWDVNRHTARCTSPVSVVWQCKLVSGWGLMKRISAPRYGPLAREGLYFTLIRRGSDRNLDAVRSCEAGLQRVASIWTATNHRLLLPTANYNLQYTIAEAYTQTCRLFNHNISLITYRNSPNFNVY